MKLPRKFDLPLYLRKTWQASKYLAHSAQCHLLVFQFVPYKICNWKKSFMSLKRVVVVLQNIFSLALWIFKVLKAFNELWNIDHVFIASINKCIEKGTKYTQCDANHDSYFTVHTFLTSCKDLAKPIASLKCITRTGISGLWESHFMQLHIHFLKTCFNSNYLENRVTVWFRNTRLCFTHVAIASSYNSWNRVFQLYIAGLNWVSDQGGALKMLTIETQDEESMKFLRIKTTFLATNVTKQ